MKYLSASLLSALFAFALQLPLNAAPAPLPIGPVLQLVHRILPPAAPGGLAIPLSIHTALDSSQVTDGRKQFFRVSEDVVADERLLFGAGAIACGYIRAIEKDATGRCLSVDIELVRVQATDGSQVALHPALIRIKTTAADGSGKVRVDAEVKGMVQAGYEEVVKL